jgi:hypothetical protein
MAGGCRCSSSSLGQSRRDRDAPVFVDGSLIAPTIGIGLVAWCGRFWLAKHRTMRGGVKRRASRPLVPGNSRGLRSSRPRAAPMPRGSWEAPAIQRFRGCKG